MFNSFLYLYQRVGSPQSSPNIRGLFHRTWLCLKIGSETKSMNHRFPLVDDHQFPPCQLECSPHHPTSRTGCFCGSSRRAALACKCFWKCAATLCCPGNVETKTCGNFRTHVCDTSHAKILSFTYCDIMIVGHSFEDLHDVRLLFFGLQHPTGAASDFAVNFRGSAQGHDPAFTLAMFPFCFLKMLLEILGICFFLRSDLQPQVS